MKIGDFNISRNSVFTRTLTTLMLMFVALLVFFLVVIWGVLGRIQEKRAEEINIQMLEQTSEMLETTMQMMTAELNQIQWNEQVVSYMIRSDKVDSGSEMNLMNLLQSTANENELIQSLWIYRPDTGRLIDSEGYAGIMEEYPHVEFMNDRQSSTQVSYPEDERHEVDMIFYDSHMYLIQDMVLARYIGSICMEMDVDSLYHLLKIDGYDDTFILEGEGKVILPTDINLQMTSLEHLQKRGMDSNKTRFIDGTDVWYVSHMDDWNLYIVRKHRMESIGFMGSIVPILLIGSILFLLMGTIGAFYITRRIYGPINQLVSLVLNYRRDMIDEDENEFSYLKLSFFDTMKESSQMRHSMSFFEQDIQEQVIRKILQGYSLQEAGIHELEEHWKRRWSDADQYQVVTCQIVVSENNPIHSEIHPQLCYQTIREIVREKVGTMEHVVVQMEEDIMAIVLASEHLSAHEFQKLVSQMEKDIQDVYSANALFRIHLAHGRSYRRLEDISYSWDEGKKQIRYSAYLANSAVKDETVFAEEKLEKEQYYQDRAVQIFDQIIRNQYEEAIGMLGYVLDDLLQQEAEDEKAWKYYEILRDTFLERCLSVAGWKNPDNGKNYGEKPPRSQWKQMMNGSLGRQMNQLFLVTQRKSYRYVENALRYITENYTDSDLSSQMVADYLHLTGSYFSEIFNEHMKESFSSCLNRIRVENAQTLLLETDIVIRDIGFKCGFTTIQHFNRMFKKYSGVTPKQYRDMHMKGDNRDA